MDTLLLISQVWLNEWSETKGQFSFINRLAAEEFKRDILGCDIKCAQFVLLPQS